MKLVDQSSRGWIEIQQMGSRYRQSPNACVPPVNSQPPTEEGHLYAIEDTNSPQVATPNHTLYENTHANAQYTTGFSECTRRKTSLPSRPQHHPRRHREAHRCSGIEDAGRRDHPSPHLFTPLGLFQRWWARSASASSCGKVSTDPRIQASPRRCRLLTPRHRTGADRQWHEADQLARCGPHQPKELLHV